MLPSFRLTTPLLLSILVVPILSQSSDAQRWRLPGTLGRNGRQTLEAFSEVGEAHRDAVVRLRSGRKSVAIGSVVRSDGWILTKSTLLPDEAICEFFDGRKLPILEKLRFPEHDLALFRVDADDLPTISFEDAPPLQVGQWAISLQPSELPAAVGVVSVGERRIRSQRAFLGVEIIDEDFGPVIARVVPDSAADRAGFEARDQVREVAGTKVRTRRELTRAIRSQKPGVPVSFQVARGSSEVTLTAVLGQPDSDPGDFENAGPVSLRYSGFPSAFQHDARLRPEKCGGPVLTLDGKAIGVNVARANRTACFAIPAPVVRDFLAKNLPAPARKAASKKEEAVR